MAPIDAELERLYVTEKMSLADIGKLYGVHGNQVRRWMIRAGIPTRGISEATSLAQKGKAPSIAQLEASKINLEKARAARTPEAYRKQGDSMRKRYASTPHPSKGTTWSEETRAAHAYRQTAEYREKMKATRKRGADHYNWKGGVLTEHERKLFTHEWSVRRKECYERDRWLCQDCGCKCLSTKEARDKGLTKQKIQAHHIMSRRDGGLDDLENLVTLCVSCHQRRERLGI